MNLRSEEFAHGEPMPNKYSREGDELSPPFVWDGVPEEADALALLCEDPDAPGEQPFTHWVVFNIPTEKTGLPEGGPIPGTEGRNDFGEQGYGGPMPPEGDGPHRYFFRLYAIDRVLDLQPDAGREQLVQAMQGHAIDQAEWMGTYERGRGSGE